MRRRSFYRLLGIALVFALAAGVGTPRPVVACTSEHPSFEQAVAGAQAVAWAEVDLGANGEVQPGVPPLRTVEVLAGDPTPFLSGDLRTGLCGDTIPYLFGDGARVIVAFGVPFFDQIIHPAWGSGDDGSLFGTAENPLGVNTIEGLEAAVRERFPVAQANASGPVSIDGSWLVVLGAAIATVIGLRLAWRRPSQ